MGLLDKIKRNKVETKTETESKVQAAPSVAPSDKSGKSHRVLVRPLLTEKSMGQVSAGRYVFVVSREANKPEIKKSIQKLYNVHVKQINIINLHSKKRRYGKAKGETSGQKKAVVTLQKGEKIPGIVEAVG